MKIVIIIILSLLAVECVASIISHKINSDNIQYLLNSREKIELFKKSFNFVEQQLRIHNLKDCPIEEKDVIASEIVDFIEEIKVYW